MRSKQAELLAVSAPATMPQRCPHQQVNARQQKHSARPPKPGKAKRDADRKQHGQAYYSQSKPALLNHISAVKAAELSGSFLPIVSILGSVAVLWRFSPHRFSTSISHEATDGFFLAAIPNPVGVFLYVATRA